jgi:hypothetical protein
LLTVTVNAADVRELPAASRATAVNVWLPFDADVVFHAAEYGLIVSSAPAFTPSTLNCTPMTRTLSDALAVIVTVAETVDPLAGAVIDTDGRVLSALLTVTLTEAEVVLWPAASRATAVRTCVPFVTPVVFHDFEYGAAYLPRRGSPRRP